MNAVAKLNELIATSNKTWRAMMRGPVADSCTIRGQEGVNYIAWCNAADAERAHREANGWDFPTTGKYNYHPQKAA